MLLIKWYAVSGMLVKASSKSSTTSKSKACASRDEAGAIASAWSGARLGAKRGREYRAG